MECKAVQMSDTMVCDRCGFKWDAGDMHPPRCLPTGARVVRARPSYDEWFIGLAKVIATRSTCARRAVGAIIVDRENRILSTGYNGVPPGVRHCTDHPCAGADAPSGQGLDVCQALHAEQNAIARLMDVRAAHTLYCTTAPCIMCAKLISATPIQRIVAAVPYALSGRDFWVNVVGREWVQMGE